MRVKCINDKWGAHPEAEGAPRPVFLNDYTVLYTVPIEDKDYYVLVEFSEEWVYEAAFFATLPDEPAEVIEESIEEPELQTV